MLCPLHSTHPCPHQTRYPAPYHPCATNHTESRSRAVQPLPSDHAVASRITLHSMRPISLSFLSLPWAWPLALPCLQMFAMCKGNYWRNDIYVTGYMVKIITKKLQTRNGNSRAASCVAHIGRKGWWDSWAPFLRLKVNCFHFLILRRTVWLYSLFLIQAKACIKNKEAATYANLLRYQN